MAMNRAQFKKELQEGLNAVFGLEYKRHPELWKDMFDVETEGRKAYVEDVLLTGFGAAQTKAEGTGVAYDSASEGYVSRYVFETIALAFALTEEAMEDNLYGDLGAKFSKALARSFQYTKNVKGANIYNNAFSSSFTGGDGVALCSASHPLVGGGTGSNILGTAADFSETSLEDMLILIGGVTDDKGIPMSLSPKSLHIPIQTQFIAQRVLGADKRSGTADNDPNAVKSMGILTTGDIKTNVYLTDPDAWFIRTDCNDALKAIQRKAMSGGVEGDFESGNMRFKKRERYVFGWSDWRGLFGTSGS